LADKMGVKAQYISRIVKGTENLTLETISKLEKALGKDLMSIPD
ncbi:MAG: helix-turn-helix transcriptional regulator, partial [Bacteroidetes bacterium]|nr:helix-turn-helix transcriptional regulator [Candidatus Cryptobacteroides faecigallinarum]